MKPVAVSTPAQDVKHTSAPHVHYPHALENPQVYLIALCIAIVTYWTDVHYDTVSLGQAWLKRALINLCAFLFAEVVQPLARVESETYVMVLISAVLVSLLVRVWRIRSLASDE